MTPIEISILLHYHASPEDYPGAVLSAGERASGRAPGPAVRNAVDRFVRAGLLIDTHQSFTSAAPLPPCPIPGAQRYRASEGLAVYVEALGAVPLPVRQWVMPGGYRPEPTTGTPAPPPQRP